MDQERFARKGCWWQVLGCKGRGFSVCIFASETEMKILPVPEEVDEIKYVKISSYQLVHYISCYARCRIRSSYLPYDSACCLQMHIYMAKNVMHAFIQSNFIQHSLLGPSRKFWAVASQVLQQV